MNVRRRLRLGATLAISASSLALGLTMASSSPSGASAPRGTITFAEAPQTPPNYIFPYVGFANFSVSTLNQFQMLMFRPMYWFGLGTSPAYVPSLSLANSPVWSNGNKTLTIKMKGWKFADGQTVDAQSVMFFLNLYKADPKAYAGYVPGYGIPDQVTSATGSGNTVVMNFNKPINKNWLLYNYLSEITPFPDSWDITAPGQTSTCATGAFGAASTDTACKAVEAYLDGQSSKISTYTDAMWQSGVDGPWKLQSMDTLGNVTFVPNTKYSGPQKAQVAMVKEVPFASAAAELNALRAGSIDLGYVDTTQITSPAPGIGKAGPNIPALAGRYNLKSGLSWAYNYDPINFSKTNPLQAVFHQLYFRQALQMGTDQKGIINKIFKGYGIPTWSPVPYGAPASISKTPKNPYPFSLSKAKSLLTSHGWAIQGGVMTCVKPGTNASSCGSGVKAGTKLNLTLEYVSGAPAVTDTVNAEVSDWKTIGINTTTSTNTFNNVISGCGQSGTQKWEICTWGAGWIYAPDYYPSGEELLYTGAGSNNGSYSNPKMDAIIRATFQGNSTLSAYAQFAAVQVPVLYQPTQTPVGEFIKTLKGAPSALVPSVLQNFMPEYLHF